MTPARLALAERGEETLPQWRCPVCGALLFKASVRLDTGECIEAYCRGCRRLVVFTAQPQVDEHNNVA